MATTVKFVGKLKFEATESIRKGTTSLIYIQHIIKTQRTQSSECSRKLFLQAWLTPTCFSRSFLWGVTRRCQLRTLCFGFPLVPFDFAHASKP